MRFVATLTVFVLVMWLAFQALMWAFPLFGKPFWVRMSWPVDPFCPPHYHVLSNGGKYHYAEPDGSESWFDFDSYAAATNGAWACYWYHQNKKQESKKWRIVTCKP